MQPFYWLPFLLTVLVDLTVAIEIGMVLAAFLFMRKMTQFSNVRELNDVLSDVQEEADTESVSNFIIPKGVVVYEINGPLFFGAAYKFKDAINIIEKTPKVLILRMRNVPIIDATGIRTLEEVQQECYHQHTKLILSEVNHEGVFEELQKARLIFKIGKANVVNDMKDAISRSQQVLTEK